MLPQITQLKVFWSIHLHFEMDLDNYALCLPSPFRPLNARALPEYTISCYCWEREFGRSFSIIRHIPMEWIVGLSKLQGRYILGFHQSKNGGKMMRKKYGKRVELATIKGKVQQDEISLSSQVAGLEIMGNLTPEAYTGPYWHAVSRNLPEDELYFSLGRKEAFRGFLWSNLPRPIFPMGVYGIKDSWVEGKGLFPAGTLRLREASWQSTNQVQLMPRTEVMRQSVHYTGLPSDFLLPSPLSIDHR